MTSLRELREDPDIRAEAAALRGADDAIEEAVSVVEPEDVVPLNVVSFSHRPTPQTRAMVEQIGGIEKLRKMTASFYEKAFADPHLDQFIRVHGDHHGERFAAWIAEKLGDAGRPWTRERAQRGRCPFSAHGHRIEDAHDRSSAHFAAWHSPKRANEDWGEHFKLDDCRVWMRLHFWALRDAGLADTPFGKYYVRFIAHFVSVYERSAPPFARESLRWSADPANIAAYLECGRRMPDVMGLPLGLALETLPEDERDYSGSGADDPAWPYELRAPAVE
uniref:Uncharacterized protein n=1 Tax=Phaeomonas parva TaxID=124430 RepID=A0A6U4CPD7_9STRA|mmetsp:Transcript_14209/g.42542  ORF Transcript_14209/g.42542 Transcript_14209/m.42542 type:complete len:277 (+) Transcript_14209:139-969(+)|eukprot:CAMPEP_0118853550 /NCGR_PEP_ID=MMETSP1163-20130328/2096_1 /TAXON_ID=124430 /ORGANISM="Phaeomonas parva, Strain CCMP2877" /LENGTH=276 /DNA_ID=CAMNT_0006786119 /DNA_START=268 /DNA_END=1098 /DNA_ORIENTATION=+